MKKFAATFESELAVQQLQDEEQKAESGSPQAYENFVQQTETEAIAERDKLIEEKEEEEGFDDNSSEIGEDNPLGDSGEMGPEGGDDSGGDGDSDQDIDVNVEEVEDPDAIDDEEVKAELVESNENLNALAASASGAASFITSSVGDIMTGLGRLGIKYTPVIASLMYKGVLWLFSRTGTLIYRTSTALTKYIESNINSVDRLTDRLDACSDRLKAIIEAGTPPVKGQYTNKSVITRLKVGRSVGIAYNLDAATTGMKAMVDSLVEEAKNSYNIVERLAETNPDNGPKNFGALMEVEVDRSTMVEGYPEGFENDTGLVIQYRSKSVFPGDMVFMLNAPQAKNRDMEGIAAAYRESTSFLAVDSKSVKLIESMDMLSPHELVRAIQATRRVVSMMRELNGTYKALQSVQPSLAYSVKKLFLQLADDEAKTRLSASYIEPMYLRSSLASSVLLSGVMDLNTYASKLAAASVTLVEEHIRKMS